MCISSDGAHAKIERKKGKSFLFSSACCLALGAINSYFSHSVFQITQVITIVIICSSYEVQIEENLTTIDESTAHLAQKITCCCCMWWFYMKTRIKQAGVRTPLLVMFHSLCFYVLCPDKQHRSDRIVAQWTFGENFTQFMISKGHLHLKLKLLPLSWSRWFRL